MRLLRGNLMVQFSVVSFVIMVILAVAISTILNTRLSRNMELLKEHGATMMAGAMIKATDPYSIPSLTRDVGNLRWITYGAVGAGFIILYVSLVSIVWRGWRTISRQQAMLAETNKQLQAAYEDLNETQKRLVLAEQLAHGSPL